ncbi:MAG: hypothetical protein HXY34_10975 [Candidatus Thorarchaeota archaeon]|nr:hypothetical protein [Candidatus Thorarchaeota archaeon]
MEDLTQYSKAARTLSYSHPESAVIFKIAWNAVASRPGVLLEEYSEAESQVFKGKAHFSLKIGDKPFAVNVWVDESKKEVEFVVWSRDKSDAESLLGELMTQVSSQVSKYNELPDDSKQRVKRALLAKICWDRLVFAILNKAPLDDVYMQIAHGREMFIKATEGEELHPLALTTSGWLRQLEPLPRSDPLPGGLATELAKKSVEWKKDTLSVLSKYL